MSNHPSASADISETNDSQIRFQLCEKRKRNLLFAMVGYALFMGLVSAWYSDDDPLTDFIIGLPFLVMGNMWCYRDAEQQNRRIGASLRLSLALIFAIGFPVYVLRTRGFAGFVTLFYASLFVGSLFACITVPVFVMDACFR